MLARANNGRETLRGRHGVSMIESFFGFFFQFFFFRQEKKTCVFFRLTELGVKRSSTFVAPPVGPRIRQVFFPFFFEDFFLFLVTM